MLLDQILLNWQKDVFEQFLNHDKLLLVCSRQVGKSFISAFCAIYDLVINSNNWCIISTNLRASKNMFSYCLKIIKYFYLVFKNTPLKFEYSNNANEIKINDNYLVCLPTSDDGNGLRGRSCSICLDELAFIHNAETLYKAIIPFLTNNLSGQKKIIISSTPNGKTGVFYDLYKNDESYYKIKVPITDACLDPKLNIDIDEIRNNCLDELSFAQEYMCEFLDRSTSLSFFGINLYDVLTDDKIQKFDQMYLGIDFAGVSKEKSDFTSLVLIGVKDRKIYVIETIDINFNTFEEQINYILDYVKKYHITMLNVDGTGLGLPLFEQLKTKLHGIPINKFMFTNKSKQMIFDNLKREFNKDNIKILDLDKSPNLISSINNITRYTTNNTVIYKTIKNNDVKIKHSDSACALALAVHCTYIHNVKPVILK